MPPKLTVKLGKESGDPTITVLELLKEMRDTHRQPNEPIP